MMSLWWLLLLRLWRGPGSCKYREYSVESAKQCLAKQYPNIMLIGDSRGRQIFSALRQLLNSPESPFMMFDSAWKMPESNFVNAQGSKCLNEHRLRGF